MPETKRVPIVSLADNVLPSTVPENLVAKIAAEFV